MVEIKMEQKEVILDVLAKAKQQGVNAFLGGGWVRDTLLGKTPKDVDIFVLGEQSTFLTKYFPKHVTHHPLDVGASYGKSVDYGGSGDSIREDVDKIEKYDIGDLDIIYMKHSTILSACSSFDSSICQCYAILDEEGNLCYYVSDDFKEYEDNNTIYFYSDIQTTEGHIERIKSKFPDATYKDKMLTESKPYTQVFVK